MKITQIALNFKATVYTLILFALIIGFVSYSQMPLESAPDVPIPIMLVHTIYPGVAPEDIERLVTNIMERELKELKDVKNMTSSSSESSSMIMIEFETEVDLDVAYQKVKDKVDKAKRDLPSDAEDPMIIEINVSEFPIMLVTFTGDYDLKKLKESAEKIQDKIEEIKGVLDVELAGGIDREIHIYLDPAKMENYEVGVGNVLERIQEEHRTTPAGNLTLGNSKYSVRIPGEYKVIRHMEDIVLKAPNGHPVSLKDVARVVDGFKERETISRYNGKECVSLSIKKRAGENIVRIADEVRALLKKEETSLPTGTTYKISRDQSEIVRNLVSDLENNIITGLVLVLAVLLFFLGIKNASFVAIAIPLSMLISFIVLNAMDITLNMVVLFSLILALGMLVDNSIVVVENIYRHISEGTNREKAAYIATSEVAWPIIASTTTTVLVFLPLLFWPGIMGNFMQYLPITVIIVLSSSLFVALVINPTLASSFMKAKPKKLFDDEGIAVGTITRKYQNFLRWSLNHPVILQITAALFFVIVFALYSKFGTGLEFFPRVTPNNARITQKAPRGTILEYTDKQLKRVETILQKEANILDYIASAGVTGAMFGGSETPSHSGVVDIEFLDPDDRKTSTWDTIDSIREKLGKFAGTEYKIDTEEMGPPTGAPVSVEISGPSYKKLKSFAAEVKELLATIPDIVDIKNDYDTGKPEIRIKIDRERAMLRKVNTMSISTAVRAAINGIKASVLREGDEEYDIIVRYDEKFRKSIRDILNIVITGKDDIQIPLRDVAQLYTTGGYGSINHIKQKRTIAVTADVSGRSSSEVMKDVEKLISDKIKPEAGYSIKFTGESEDEKESQTFLLKAFGTGLFLIIIILITQFNSVLRTGVILASVIMSLLGVLIGLMITQNKFGIIMTGLGVISLAGIVVNNAIVLIDYTDQLKEKGLPLKEALLRAGVVRFRPVLLTAITTILGLMPMAVGIGINFTELFKGNFAGVLEIGSQTVEMWGAMAQAVCFGLALATVLTLVLVPVMYNFQEDLKSFIIRKFKNIFYSTSDNTSSGGSL